MTNCAFQVTYVTLFFLRMTPGAAFPGLCLLLQHIPYHMLRGKDMAQIPCLQGSP